MILVFRENRAKLKLITQFEKKNMATFNPANLPAGINTFEELALYALKVLGSVLVESTPGFNVLVPIDGSTQPLTAPVIRQSAFRDGSGIERIAVSIYFKMPANWDLTAGKPWSKTEELTTAVPSADALNA